MSNEIVLKPKILVASIAFMFWNRRSPRILPWPPPIIILDQPRRKK